MIGTLALIVVIAILIVYIIIIFNSLVSLKNNIGKAYANIDVLLKQRNDELPNLINTVKGYMKYENNLLIILTKARTSFLNAKTVSQKATVDDSITNTLRSIFAVAENYPKLKANDNFMLLQKRISGLENEIADRREFYNDSVNNYNIRIQSFPDIIFAKLFGFNEQILFKATKEEKDKLEFDIK